MCVFHISFLVECTDHLHLWRLKAYLRGGVCLFVCFFSTFKWKHRMYLKTRTFFFLFLHSTIYSEHESGLRQHFLYSHHSWHLCQHSLWPLAACTWYHAPLLCAPCYMIAHAITGSVWKTAQTGQCPLVPIFTALSQGSSKALSLIFEVSTPKATSDFLQHLGPTYRLSLRLLKAPADLLSHSHICNHRFKGAQHLPF